MDVPVCFYQYCLHFCSDTVVNIRYRPASSITLKMLVRQYKWVAVDQNDLWKGPDLLPWVKNLTMWDYNRNDLRVLSQTMILSNKADKVTHSQWELTYLTLTNSERWLCVAGKFCDATTVLKLLHCNKVSYIAILLHCKFICSNDAGTTNGNQDIWACDPSPVRHCCWVSARWR